MPISSVTVFFTTDLGMLSSPWAITDSNGQANVTLSAVLQNGTSLATISATWASLSNSIQVTFTDGRPVAVLTVDATTVTTYDLLVFDASNSYDADGWIESYFWEFGDGNTSTDITPTHFYTDDGIYTVTLNVTDNIGEINSTVTIITVGNQPPIPLFTVSPQPPVSLGQLLSFDASDSYDPDGTITSYVWDYGDNTGSGSGLTTTYRYASPGLYSVTLTVTDDDDAPRSYGQTIEVTG